MGKLQHLPKLYQELADWWPILSSPEDYAEEAAFYRELIIANAAYPPKTMLELGSGGGNNASFLKEHFRMTLVDISPGMIEVSRKLNPECIHLLGDMRTFRLERQFDAVFIHDAIVYMTSEVDLRRAIQTAYLHCKPGGVALFAPDLTRDTFQASTGHGGHDGQSRSLRYLEWTFDPDPDDTRYISYMVYLLREGYKEVRCVVDEHECGLFANDQWLGWIADEGFEPRMVPFEHHEIEPGSVFVFLGIKK